MIGYPSKPRPNYYAGTGHLIVVHTGQKQVTVAKIGLTSAYVVENFKPSSVLDWSSCSSKREQLQQDCTGQAGLISSSDLASSGPVQVSLIVLRRL